MYFGNSCFPRIHQAKARYPQLVVVVGGNNMVISTAFDTDPQFMKWLRSWAPLGSFFPLAVFSLETTEVFGAANTLLATSSHGGPNLYQRHNYHHLLRLYWAPQAEQVLR